MRVSGWIIAIANHVAASSISQYVIDLLLGKSAITSSIDTQIRCLKHIFINFTSWRCIYSLYISSNATFFKFSSQMHCVQVCLVLFQECTDRASENSTCRVIIFRGLIFIFCKNSPLCYILCNVVSRVNVYDSWFPQRCEHR